MYTPNLDALATQSLLLKRAYIQITSCLPSRSPMLTSRRPHNTRLFNNGPNVRKVGGNCTTLPQYFKQHGYTTVGLGKAVAGTQSFFIATGFYKPHFPFVFPESFLGHCRDVELPSNSYAPREMPTIVWSPYMELNSYADIRKLRVSSAMNAPFLDEVAIDLRRAYYATVSYTDSLNLFEESVHIPLIIRVPGITDTGVSSRQITEFVDLFPTLVEAAGLPRLPECPEDSRNVTTCTDGKSLLPLIRNPNIPIRAATFSQFRRCSDVMGYSDSSSSAVCPQRSPASEYVVGCCEWLIHGAERQLCHSFHAVFLLTDWTDIFL
ncbi:iduronate 2-sulfatase-like [Dreissena polymorpha]|uniref:iduronate 2-sulfatase-like n=1 Tax=Dreissena polymorpha TaxID=45954 RepID=UPI0022645C43|nr:iduronate 2-sulfatase-like [Dreissena polymorpha]